MGGQRDERWATFQREVPARQHGVAGVWQAIAHRIPRQSFLDHARDRGWSQLSPGVWAERSISNTYERVCWAALVGLRLRGHLTGVSALWMYGAFGDLATRPAIVEVLMANARHHPRQRSGVRVLRGSRTADDALDRRRGFHVVPALRAWSDYARGRSVTQALDALAGLDRLREATPEDAARYLDQRGRFAGARAARAALAQARGQFTHSRDEQAARRLLAAAALPLVPWPRPLTIRVEGGPVAEVDIPWPTVRFGVEVDGPHHVLPAQQQADRARDRLLATLGWIIVRFSGDEVERSPEEFVREVRAGLAAAIDRAPAAWPT